MTDWKMPGWMREVLVWCRLADRINSIVRRYNTGDEGVEGFVRLLELVRVNSLLSTPTERDEQEKRVIRWGKERTAMMKEITKQERRIAELKSALDNAEKENNAAWVLK